MLIFPLKKEWFEKIQSGKKTIEYREVKPYWTSRLWKAGISAPYDYNKLKKSVDGLIFPIKCILRLGYTKQQMKATISKVEIVDGRSTDLHVSKSVYAIHLTDVTM